MATTDMVLHREGELEREAAWHIDITQALKRKEAMRQFIGQILREGEDYGKIPGTDRKTLLKPGAEKLASVFGLTPEFIQDKVIEDWHGEGNSQREPFFFYRVKCRLTRRGQFAGEADGSCNSWESKYRYRESKRKCPKCCQEAIIPGKQEWGGGWLCWTKKGGCGAKYADGDENITGQQVGRVPNPEVFDQVNTVLKMAQKRGFIAAVLIATNTSDSFTQDLEDFEGAPVAADTQAVAEKRIAEEQAKLEKQRAERKPAKATPQDEGTLDPEVEKMWVLMGTSPKDIIRTYAELKQAIVAAGGSERQYYEILAQHKMSHANDTGVPFQKHRVVTRELFELLQRMQQEPPPEAA